MAGPVRDSARKDGSEIMAKKGGLALSPALSRTINRIPAPTSERDRPSGRESPEDNGHQARHVSLMTGRKRHRRLHLTKTVIEHPKCNCKRLSHTFANFFPEFQTIGFSRALIDTI